MSALPFPSVIRSPNMASEYDPALHGWVGEPACAADNLPESALLVGLGSLAALAALYALTKGQQRAA
jgi:hypothetical protein